MARYLKEEIKKKDIISLGLNSDIETTVANAHSQQFLLYKNISQEIN